MTSPPNFDLIEKEIRKRTYGILRTVTSRDKPLSSSINYGVSQSDERFRIYILLKQDDEIARYLRDNPTVSLFIPFCHQFFCFLPFSLVYFESNAELIPSDNPKANLAFRKKRVLKKHFQKASISNLPKDMLFIRLKPNNPALIFRPGLRIRHIFSKDEKNHYIVKIPSEKY